MGLALRGREKVKTMRPIWLIDADCEGTNSVQLQAVIRNHGFDCRAVKFFPGNRFPDDIAGAEDIPLDARVVFFGGPALMAHIKNHRRWNPGGWCSFENFSCHVYYSYFGRYLLNADYSLLPASEAVRQADLLFETYSSAGDIFVRPSIGRKLFTGSVVDRDEYSRELLRLDPQTLVVSTSPKVIGREWRLYVAGDQIIAHSQYAKSRKRDVCPTCPRDALDFGSAILNQTMWRPDLLFTMDICESNDNFYLVELNGFSCSNLYAADLDEIVSAVSRAQHI